MSEFNPEIFGFEIYEPKSFGNSRLSSDCDYIRIATGKKTTQKAALILSEDTHAVVRDIIGEKIGIGINERGVLILFDTKNPRVAHTMHKQNKSSIRWEVSISGMYDKLRSFYGDFRRLPLEADLYAKGEAIILKPITDKIERR